MSVVNVSDISPGLFITGAVFILLIFSLLSLGILRLFQLRRRAGLLSFAGAAVSGVLFWTVLERWFV